VLNVVLHYLTEHVKGASGFIDADRQYGGVALKRFFNLLNPSCNLPAHILVPIGIGSLTAIGEDLGW
jgi:hypothetical protein